MEKSILTIKSTELCQSAYRLAAEVQKKQKEFLLSHQLLDGALRQGLLLQQHSSRRLGSRLSRARYYGAQIGLVLDLLLAEKAISSEQYESIEGVRSEVAKMIQASLTTIYRKKHQSPATQSSETVV